MATTVHRPAGSTPASTPGAAGTSSSTTPAVVAIDATEVAR